jgi:hypothetical protein
MSDVTEPIAETAQSHLETLVPTAGPEEPVGRAVALLSSGQHAIADSIYIVDAEHCLLGVVPVAALLTTARDGAPEYRSAAQDQARCQSGVDRAGSGAPAMRLA